jgi:predicted enzyme related to lactoylglutathione lyase
MPADKKINYVEFPANDLDAVEAFYRAVFGWTFTSYGPEYLAFADGNLDGGFYKSDKRASYGEGSALIVFYATDLEGAEAAIKAHGGTIHKAIFGYHGGRRFHFLDPHGNELAVWSDQ